KKVPGGAGKIELDFPVTTLEDLTSVDELARVSEVVSAAARGSVSVRGVRKAGLFLLVEVDPSFDLEGAVVDVSPFSGVAEDPVCGSAHCALAPYWSQALKIPPGEVIEARMASKRGGDLDLIWEKTSGRVRIQGSAVITMRGEMYL
ncbi:hypothetical protein FRC00_008238, partial [Tulasnella sp. 408]